MRDPSIEAMLAEARATYAASLPGKIADVRSLGARGAWEEARRAAHKLRGSAGSYGFEALGDVMAAIEDTILAAGDAPDAETRARIDARLDEAEAHGAHAAGGEP